jgi:hypothetical protein
MSPAGRSSGEYPIPVTQEQFGGFVAEFRAFREENNDWMSQVNRSLSNGEATMAVLRNDTAEFRRRSDDQSSKINLLIQNDKVRAAIDKRDETVEITTVPPKQTFTDMIKDKFLSALAMVVVAVCMATGWTLLRGYVAEHPNLPGDETSSPVHREHERGRDPSQLQAIPASAPASSGSPLGPPKPP